MKVLRMLIWIPVVVIAVYLIILAYIYFNQDKMVFYPTSEIVATPHQIGLDFSDIILTVDTCQVHGWYIEPDDGDSSKVVLFCHGNAGNISHRLETARFLHDLGVAVILIDYRGYGKSTGKTTEEGVYADARAYYDWLVNTKQYRPENIFIFGRSLGGAVSVELASRVKSGGLIVESSFTTIGDMGKKLFPVFPIKMLINYKFDSINKIGKLDCPVVVTHSPDDDLIPYKMGEKLYETAKEPKKFVKLSGGHNAREYFQDSTYVHTLRELFGLDNRE